MNSRQEPSAYAQRFLQEIFNGATCARLADLAGESELQRLCSASELRKLDFGLWMGKLAISGIMCSRAVEREWCSVEFESKVMDSVEQQLQTFIPQDSTVIRVGDLVQNKEELAFLKANGLIPHTFFKPIASRNVEKRLLMLTLWRGRYIMLNLAFQQGLQLDAIALERDPSTISARRIAAIDGGDYSADVALFHTARVFWGLISDEGEVKDTPRNFEAVQMIYKFFEEGYGRFRECLSEIGSEQTEGSAEDPR